MGIFSWEIYGFVHLARNSMLCMCCSFGDDEIYICYPVQLKRNLIVFVGRDILGDNSCFGTSVTRRQYRSIKRLNVNLLSFACRKGKTGNLAFLLSLFLF